MNIALDFDGTWSADPVFWEGFIEAAISRGHLVWIVTGRDDTPENRRAIYETVPPQVRVIFCDHAPKMQRVAELGMQIDWWIDDHPECIPVEALGRS